MKMIKNVLFEVLPIARFYIFPTCLAIGGCHAKKTVALLRQTSHRVIFEHFEYTQSTVIYQEHAHSMRFCNSFLQMVTENQCCPQIVVSRHKIRHVQRYYKLCCCMKLVLFRVENVCEMSTKTFGINDAV